MLRRVTAEQFEDTISAVTGEWRLSSKRTDTHSTYTREWRLKSDPLSRALGRPIRDQVYTERSADATTLQALELTNGPLLSKRLERGAKMLLGELAPVTCQSIRQQSHAHRARFGWMSISRERMSFGF